MKYSVEGEEKTNKDTHTKQTKLDKRVEKESQRRNSSTESDRRIGEEGENIAIDVERNKQTRGILITTTTTIKTIR